MINIQIICFLCCSVNQQGSQLTICLTWGWQANYFTTNAVLTKQKKATLKFYIKLSFIGNYFGLASRVTIFRIKTMFESSLLSVVCRRAHVLFTLLCLSTNSGIQHILCCVFGLFFLVLCTLCCQFLWIIPFFIVFRYSLIFIEITLYCPQYFYHDFCFKKSE